MLERRSLKAPITLGVVMILLVVALTVGWVSINVILLTDTRWPGSADPTSWPA